MPPIYPALILSIPSRTDRAFSKYHRRLEGHTCSALGLTIVPGCIQVEVVVLLQQEIRLNLLGEGV